MKNIKFTFPNAPTNEAEIMAYESLIGFALPSDYRQFLLEYNGGEAPKPCFFQVEAKERSVLKTLYPVKGPAGFDLFDMFTWMEDKLPRGVIRVGDDICGNPICIALEGKLADAVLWLDHEKRTDDPWANLFLCARTFAAFIDSLRDDC